MHRQRSSSEAYNRRRSIWLTCSLSQGSCDLCSILNWASCEPSSHRSISCEACSPSRNSCEACRLGQSSWEAYNHPRIIQGVWSLRHNRSKACGLSQSSCKVCRRRQNSFMCCSHLPNSCEVYSHM